MALVRSYPKSAELIRERFRAFHFYGVESAILEWTYNSWFNTREELEILAEELKKFRDFYGENKDYNIIARDPITPSTNIYYFEAGHEKGVLLIRELQKKT